MSQALAQTAHPGVDPGALVRTRRLELLARLLAMVREQRSVLEFGADPECGYSCGHR